MLLNKYKYSLNRGLHIRTEAKKKGVAITTFAMVSQSTPVLYGISINPQKDAFILYNQHEYLHRKCTYVADSNSELLKQAKQHSSDKNNFTVFIAQEQEKSEQIIMGQDGKDSIINQAFRNMLSKKNLNSSIALSVVGVCTQNMLTDELHQQFNQPQDYKLQTVRQVLRLKNNDHSINKYQLEGITKVVIHSERELSQRLAEYREMKNQKQYLSISQKKYWDWLQGQLFILEQIRPQNQQADKTVVKSHYILKVNQYLQTGSSLMLNLGIVLRKLQQNNRKGAQSNESKLFKFISNCWTSSNLQNIHLFLQIGHHPTLKQQYIDLVPTSEIVSPLQDSQANFEDLSFCYIKGYENYPKITSFLSKLNKDNNKSKQKSSLESEHENLKIKVRPYARDTFSSIQKRRVNSIQMQFQQTQSQHNNDLDSIIHEAASLYRQENQDNFRLSYHKKSNEAVLKRHKRVVERFSTIDKPPSEFYRSERMRSKETNKQFVYSKTPKETIKSQHKESGNFKLDSAFQIYTKGKRIRNYRKYYSRKQKRQLNDLVDDMVKKEIFELERDEDLKILDEAHKEFY